MTGNTISIKKQLSFFDRKKSTVKARKKIIVTLLCAVFFSTAAYGTSTIWSWMKDMYNQPSIKPQEEGSFKNFPIGSVTTEGLQISTDGEKHLKATDFI